MNNIGNIAFSSAVGSVPVIGGEFVASYFGQNAIVGAAGGAIAQYAYFGSIPVGAVAGAIILPSYMPFNGIGGVAAASIIGEFIWRMGQNYLIGPGNTALPQPSI